MNIVKRSLVSSASAATGIVVIIDVLRACTTIPIVLFRGAKEIWPIASEAEINRSHPSYLTIGEVEHGASSSLFDFNNPPSEVCLADLAGRTVFLKTNNATEAMLNTSRAKETVLCSLVNIAAIANYILHCNPEEVKLLALGRLNMPGVEDEVCASALEVLLLGSNIDQKAIIQKVLNCDCAVLVQDRLGKPEDVELAVSFNAFPIVPKVYFEHGRPVIRQCS